MNVTRTARRAVLSGIVAAILGGALLGAPSAATHRPRTADQCVVAWIDRHRTDLTTDPAAPLDDLRWLRRVTHGASVVGLGESTHGSHEQFGVKHRMVRYLVEHLGFRTVAFEDDFGSGVLLDRYVTTGEGDPRQLARQMSSPFWAAEETVELLEWLRSYNETHTDEVRILGTDLLWLRRVSFDTIRAHVADVAPDQLDEMEALFEPVKLQGEEWEQFGWYRQRSADQKQEAIEAAKRLEPFLSELPDNGRSVDRAYALQHARAIVGWYENYADDGFRAGREEFIADSITWWQDVEGGRVAYWAANVHTAAAAPLTYRTPDETHTGTMAGGILEDRLGDRYVSIGTWFHHGEISSDYNAPATHAVGTPAEGLLDATLGDAGSDAFAIELPTRGGPRAVRAWLRQPSTMRVILPSYAEPDDSSTYTMTVPSLGAAFDAIVFVRETTALHLLGR